MLALALLLQIQVVDSAYATPALRDFVARAAVQNRAPPLSLSGYNATVETELALILRDSLGREIVGQLEQLAAKADWERSGLYELHVVGFRSQSLGAPYSASKHGVVGFTKALGNELAPTGITVNAVCPGYVETPMARRVRQGYAQAYATSEETILERFRAKIPLGRYSTPEEVAGLVCYLATDTAASITAQAINVCGGLGNF